MAAFLHIEVRIWKYRISTFIREDQAEKTDPRRRWLHTTYWINWGFLMNAWITARQLPLQIVKRSKTF